MTNEQAKQEAIKKAYVPKYFTDKEFADFKNCISDDGWLDVHKFRIQGGIPKPTWYKSFLPYELDKLISNNGWIRIEPDGSNLPKETGEYRVILKSGNMTELYFDPKEDLSFKPFATHYKPITPELKPIY